MRRNINNCIKREKAIKRFKIPPQAETKQNQLLLQFQKVKPERALKERKEKKAFLRVLIKLLHLTALMLSMQTFIPLIITVSRTNFPPFKRLYVTSHPVGLPEMYLNV